ncbi:NAD(P)/FAD-dependent oxidoreductase [Parasphingorhabdus pacifica]
MGARSGPEHVVIVGAGMAGLATAWFLQERGVRTTIVDRSGVAAGASWGNAGLINPAFTVPQPEPRVLRFGLRSMFDPSSPLSIPLVADRRMWTFLAAFARNCTESRWQRSMAVFNELNLGGISAYEQLADGGVAAPLKHADPFLAACSSRHDRDHLVEEFDKVLANGGSVEYEFADGAELRTLEPTLSAEVRAGVRVRGQRFINPPEYLRSLAEAVRVRGGRIDEEFDVADVRDLGPAGVELDSTTGSDLRADAAVLANGAWLGRLARPFGVRRIVQAGRGYSFSVEPRAMPTHPIYLPKQKVACNPLDDRFRVTGVMEFGSANAALDSRRIHTIVESIRPMFTGVDWDRRYDEWVGSRPCTPDGLPLIGATSSPRVYVAGGHGMWGMTFGPVTGKALADSITGRTTPGWMREVSPLR